MDTLIKIFLFQKEYIGIEVFFYLRISLFK